MNNDETAKRRKTIPPIMVTARKNINKNNNYSITELIKCEKNSIGVYFLPVLTEIL
jgi:hypothetical protein